MIKILGLKGVKNMSKTVVRKNESLDDALRRFKRAVTKAGTLQETRKEKSALRFSLFIGFYRSTDTQTVCGWREVPTTCSATLPM